MATEYDFDVVILGGGPAGYVAAIRAAQLKMKAAVVDYERLGGVCLNWGCIPTKALLKSAETYRETRQFKRLGLDVDVKGFDFASIIKRSRQIADRSSAGVDLLMKKHSVTMFQGRGRVASPHEVDISNSDGALSHKTTRHIIIATGGYSKALPFAAFDGERIFSSKEAMNLPSLPKSLVIIGAGAIGVEFAYFYAALGTKVTLIEMLKQVLPLEDTDIAETLEKSLLKLGIDIHTSTAVTSLKNHADGITVTAEGSKGSVTVQSDAALVAIGVGGNIKNLGLEEAGVRIDKGFIRVDETYQTNVPGIWAVGDVIGPPLLAHVASREAIVCVEEIAGLNPPPVDYEAIPACTYCHPQVASVGLTEKQCLDKQLNVKIGKFPFVASGKARASGDIEGFVKVILDAKSKRLLGAHIIGGGVTELVAELTLARTMGATADDILHTLHPHPTLSEAVMEATADAMGEAIHI
ncbi:dihydrolipoyl dehydrogenase [bacterium]|nr:dihydrolipoyl dehydrogenase [bacterium]